MVRIIRTALVITACAASGALLIQSATRASAASPCSTTFNCWKGPGWYQEYGDDEGGAIYAGPFASRAECEQALPEDDDQYEYTCFEYLTQPSEDVPPKH
jgi:hypothetical protein